MKTQPISLDLNQLPDDPAFLKSLVRDMAGEMEHLRHQLRAALHRHFGRKAETLSVDQLALFEKLIEKELSQEPKLETRTEPKAQAKGHGRKRPSKELPRQVVSYPLPQEQQTCPDCRGAMHKLGDDVREVLDYVPASFFVREERAEKWACGVCQDKVVSAELPAQPIERGLAGAGLLAQVAISKFADHLPLYRQSEIYSRQGVELSRSTLGGWVAQTAELLTPIYHAMIADLLESKVLHSDDTPVPVLETQEKEGPQREDAADEPQGRRKARQGRLWTWVGDEEHPQVVFEYTPDRKGEHPREFLEGWRGYLQADAYAGYDQLYESRRVIEVACWAHTRRKFFEAQDTDKERAKVALAYIHALYEVEREAKNLKADERQQRREQKARPILEKFREWLDAQALVLLPKSAMAQAMGYALRQWAALTIYVTDGDLNVDNNAAENALRCVALGRKNWLFAGSDAGGERAAILFSLVATCKRHRIDPYAYLRDVIGRIAAHPAKDVASLMPERWMAAKMAEKIAALAA